MKGHTEKKFDTDLAELQARILKMGEAVESMIQESMTALMQRDEALAQHIIGQDGEVNTLEMEIGERCVELLALYQPAASDLRFITVGIRITTDLERMGDLAVNIAERVMELASQEPVKPYVDLPKMAKRSQEMVKQVLEAFVTRNADLAQRICEADDEVDQLNRSVFRDIEALMRTDSAAISRGLRLVLIARHLERVADHATNIAEEVIYMVKGKDIRHGAGE